MREADMLEILRAAERLLDQEPGHAIDLYGRVIQQAAGPSWAEANNALASHYYGHAEYQRAADHADSVLHGSNELVEPVARARAGIMLCNARDMMDQPIDEALLRSSTELAIQTDQPYQGGVGMELLARHALLRGDRVRARVELEQAANLLDQAGSVTGGPGTLLRLAKLDIDDNRREDARAHLVRGIAHLQCFPYAGRTARMLEDKLTQLLSSFDLEIPR